MRDKEISILVLENMDKFYNLIKIVNKDRYKVEQKLTEKQFFALSRIKRYGKMELKNLSKDLNVSTSSLCILLNKLVERGYVYREEDKNDRRNTFYGITTNGEGVLSQEVDIFLGVIGEMICSLEEEDKKRLVFAMNELDYIIKKLNN